MKPSPNLHFSLVPVTSLAELTPEAFLLSFERPYDFFPGQIIAITRDPEEPPRFYSIASGSDAPLIDILFDVKPKGSLSPWLATLRAGDSLYISQPLGNFVPKDGPATWIASGTGIAPFRSMLRSGIRRNISVIQGARDTASLYFKDEFRAALGEDYHPCTSREKSEAFQGRVTDFLQQQDALSSGRLYYLCGNAEMVVDVREILLGKGIPFDNIVAEVYF